MYNEGICEAKIIPMCKFNKEKCFVNALVYSLFLREKRGGDELSIEIKDCRKCVHVESEANPNYLGGCEFCFRRNDLSDFHTEVD